MPTTHRDQRDTVPPSATTVRVIRTQEAQIPVGPDGEPEGGDWIDALIAAKWITTDTHIQGVDDDSTG